MSYSRRNSGEKPSEIYGGIVKALLVMGAALWFCNGASMPTKDAAVSAEIVTVEMPAETNFADISDDAEETEDISEEKNFINPTEGVLTSDYGMRDGRSHNGVDIGADAGTEICAADGGEVTYAGNMSGYGKYIVIDHHNGYETAYAHCSDLLVEVGENVSRGQIIAHMGSTGNSSGPHLHFEVKHCGEFCDPLDFVVY